MKYFLSKLVFIGLFVAVVTGCALGNSTPLLDVESIRMGRTVMDAANDSFQRGNFTAAAQQFELAYQLGKEAEALDGLGCIAMRLGRVVEAQQRFAQAIDRDATYGAAYGHLALAQEALGKVIEADRSFLDGIAVKPGDAQLRYDYAQFLVRRGRKEESKILMAQVHSMVPKPIRFRLKRS